jgi:hypothetical protein
MTSSHDRGGVVLTATGLGGTVRVGNVTQGTNQFIAAGSQNLSALTGNVTINRDQILSISGISANIRVGSAIFWDPVVPGVNNQWTNVNATTTNTWTKIN